MQQLLDRNDVCISPKVAKRLLVLLALVLVVALPAVARAAAGDQPQWPRSQCGDNNDPVLAQAGVKYYCSGTQPGLQTGFSYSSVYQVADATCPSGYRWWSHVIQDTHHTEVIDYYSQKISLARFFLGQETLGYYDFTIVGTFEQAGACVT